MTWVCPIDESTHVVANYDRRWTIEVRIRQNAGNHARQVHKEMGLRERSLFADSVLAAIVGRREGNGGPAGDARGPGGT